MSSHSSVKSLIRRATVATASAVARADAVDGGTLSSTDVVIRRDSIGSGAGARTWRTHACMRRGDIVSVAQWRAITKRLHALCMDASHQINVCARACVCVRARVCVCVRACSRARPWTAQGNSLGMSRQNQPEYVPLHRVLRASLTTTLPEQCS
jgi:hypothetical protein